MPLAARWGKDTAYACQRCGLGKRKTPAAGQTAGAVRLLRIGRGCLARRAIVARRRLAIGKEKEKLDDNGGLVFPPCSQVADDGLVPGAPLTTPTTGRSTVHATAAFRIGRRGARSLSQKDGLPFRCWERHLCRFKAIDARMISLEAAMNAPRRQLPQWKIDLVREAMRVIKIEKGASCDSRDDCKANPFIRDGRY
jgi:hypothetical protein